MRVHPRDHAAMSITRIWSDPDVDSRCAMPRVLCVARNADELPLLGFLRLGSSAEFASSKIQQLGPFSSARAIAAAVDFPPPPRLRPRSPKRACIVRGWR